MKKIVLTFVAMMSMTLAFAGNNEKDVEKTQKAPEASALSLNQNYDMAINYRALATTLGLNNYQMQAVELIHEKYVEEMAAAKSAGDNDRDRLVKQATDKELRYMGFVLNDQQYDKFSQLLNLTLNNRGLLD